MTYILSHPSVKFSAKLLARELGLRRRLEPQRNAPLIRWGNSEQPYFQSDTSLNARELIYITGSKYRFSAKMEELGIPHVHVRAGRPETFPVVVRQNLSASRGIGIVVCRNMEEYRRTPRNDYWSPWYNFSSELGVHMLGGNIVKVMRKIREDGMDDEEFPIRNSGRGYHFFRINWEGKKKLQPFMREIYERFPLEFGRWDIGWDADARHYRVIEANSAPDLTQNEDTLGLYVDFLRERIG